MLFITTLRIIVMHRKNCLFYILEGYKSDYTWSDKIIKDFILIKVKTFGVGFHALHYYIKSHKADFELLL